MSSCRVLVALDALLDTRQGIINKLAPTELDTILKEGYHDRVDNFFPNASFTPEAFTEAFEVRDNSILPYHI